MTLCNWCRWGHYWRQRGCRSRCWNYFQMWALMFVLLVAKWVPRRLWQIARLQKVDQLNKAASSSDTSNQFNYLGTTWRQPPSARAPSITVAVLSYLTRPLNLIVLRWCRTWGTFYGFQLQALHLHMAPDVAAQDLTRVDADAEL